MQNNSLEKLEKVPDPKLHQLISFAKSGVRIIGGSAAAIVTPFNIPYALIILAVTFVVAEIIGVWEELV